MMNKSLGVPLPPEKIISRTIQFRVKELEGTQIGELAWMARMGAQPKNDLINVAQRVRTRQRRLRGFLRAAENGAVLSSEHAEHINRQIHPSHRLLH